MDSKVFDVIVVGGGPAGVTAALRARELGAEVALVERGRLGGTCTNDGCVPTRVLAKAARLRREADHFASYGLIAETPVVDFERLIARTQQVVYTMHEKKQLVDQLIQAGVHLKVGVGEASFADSHSLILQDGTQMQADKFIICAGGHARQFPFPGSQYVLTHHDVWSLKKLPGSIAVVGGAATGCQLASILAAFGARVSLLETSQTLLAREDGLVGEVMSRLFEESGIDVIAGISGVERIEPLDGSLELFYGKSGLSQSIVVQAVIMAVGWVANSEALNLAAAGVETSRGYILVNDFMQTSAPNIFAAGDITGRMMLVQSGSYEGRIAAENAVLGVGQPYQHLIVPHGGFTNPEYASVGLTEAQARALEAECVVAVVPYAHLDRAVIDDHQDGFCKLVVSRETHRILGAHIVGEQALEAIEIIAAGMAADMWVEQLAELELAYPTYTAIVGLAARLAMRELGVVPLSPQWQSLGNSPAAEWEQSHP